MKDRLEKVFERLEQFDNTTSETKWGGIYYGATKGYYANTILDAKDTVQEMLEDLEKSPDIRAIADRLSDFIDLVESQLDEEDREEIGSIHDALIDYCESKKQQQQFGGDTGVDADDGNWGEHQELVDEALEAAKKVAYIMYKSDGWSHRSGSWFDATVEDVDLDDDDGHTVVGYILMGVDEEDGKEEKSYSFRFNENERAVDIS